MTGEACAASSMRWALCSAWGSDFSVEVASDAAPSTDSVRGTGAHLLCRRGWRHLAARLIRGLIMHHSRRWPAFGVGLLGCLSTNAHAGGPYVVDDAAIGNVGECQVESWVSVASNGDFIGVTQPACVVRIGVPVEFTATLSPVRIDGEWATLTGLQGKFILVPLEPNNIAIALTIGTLVDATTVKASYSSTFPLRSRCVTISG